MKRKEKRVDSGAIKNWVGCDLEIFQFLVVSQIDRSKINRE